MKKITTTLILFISVYCITKGQPRVSFTFDDGITSDQPGNSFEAWNKMLLDKLDHAGVKAVFFVTGPLHREKLPSANMPVDTVPGLIGLTGSPGAAAIGRIVGMRKSSCKGLIRG